jgi:outer membrane receptor protein involved in Fe transport
MSLIGTYLLGEYGSSGSNCVGLYGVRCGIPTPTWRHTLRTTWQTPWNGADVSLAWRYIGSVKNDYLSSDAALRAGSGLSDSQLISEGYVPNTDAYLSSRSYIDLTGSIKVNDVLTVRMGINNLLDKDPPIFGSSTCSTGQCNGNTFPQVYDALGRYLFVKVVAQF